MFGVVLRNFVAACDPFRKQVSKCIQRTSFCHRNQLFVFRNKHAQCTTLGPKLMFGMVSLNFIVARHLFRKLVSGCIQIMSFCKRNHFFVFATSMPNPPLYVQNPCLWWFHAILLTHVTHSGNGCRGAFKARVFATEPFLRFSQRTCPIHYFRSKTHVWGGFAQFCCRTSPITKTGVWVHTKHEFLPPEPFLCFSQRTTQSTTLGPKLMFGVVSRNFVAARHPFRKRLSWCIQSTRFFHRNHFFVFCNEHAQSTTLGSKLMVGGVSRNFVAACHPFRKRVSGYKQSTSFCHRNHFFVFRNKQHKSTTLGPKLMFGVVSRNFVAARNPFRKRVSGSMQSTSFCHQNHFFVFRNEHAQSTT
jgi:hypothetical protein